MTPRISASKIALGATSLRQPAQKTGPSEKSLNRVVKEKVSFRRRWNELMNPKKAFDETVRNNLKGLLAKAQNNALLVDVDDVQTSLHALKNYIDDSKTPLEKSKYMPHVEVVKKAIALIEIQECKTAVKEAGRARGTQNNRVHNGVLPSVQRIRQDLMEVNLDGQGQSKFTRFEKSVSLLKEGWDRKVEAARDKSTSPSNPQGKTDKKLERNNARRLNLQKKIKQREAQRFLNAMGNLAPLEGMQLIPAKYRLQHLPEASGVEETLNKGEVKLRHLQEAPLQFVNDLEKSAKNLVAEMDAFYADLQQERTELEGKIKQSGDQIQKKNLQSKPDNLELRATQQFRQEFATFVETYDRCVDALFSLGKQLTQGSALSEQLRPSEYGEMRRYGFAILSLIEELTSEENLCGEIYLLSKKGMNSLLDASEVLGLFTKTAKLNDAEPSEHIELPPADRMNPMSEEERALLDREEYVPAAFGKMTIEPAKRNGKPGGLSVDDLMRNEQLRKANIPEKIGARRLDRQMKDRFIEGAKEKRERAIDGLLDQMLKGVSSFEPGNKALES
ncbi:MULTISPECIES: hypothetical protein [unclassified Variovorax]|uniref:hypothetical protein n=1 Tax=unclassified Variovorax TaxID=663243 RepID=UPI0011AEC932|nr:MULTISPECIES: hypothetical protein [unclassified Variovorax]